MYFLPETPELTTLCKHWKFLLLHAAAQPAMVASSILTLQLFKGENWQNEKKKKFSLWCLVVLNPGASKP